jgi:hypothetical protein
MSGGLKQAFPVCGGCAVCRGQDAPTAVANAVTWPGAEVAAALAAPAAAFAPCRTTVKLTWKLFRFNDALRRGGGAGDCPTDHN